MNYPAQAEIAAHPLAYMMAGGTCGEACWHAREETCRCQCGGANHGCLRRNGAAEQPARTARIDGVMYQLAAIGTHREIYDAAVEINRAAGPRSRYTPPGFDGTRGSHRYEYPWREVDPGAPARVRYANQQQTTRWAELARYRDLDRWQWRHANVALLWVRS